MPVAERSANALESSADADLVRRAAGGEVGAFEVLMRRHNEKVYRAVRSFVRDEAEVEDVMQEAYVRAYGALAGFRGEASFSTWLIKIAIYEAQARSRRRRRIEALCNVVEIGASPTSSSSAPGPERRASSAELGAVLQAAIDALPESQRAVLMLRSIEGLSTAETADCLGISRDNVRVRMHRSRAALRAEVERRMEVELGELFRFHLRRCGRVSAAVLARIAPDTDRGDRR